MRLATLLDWLGCVLLVPGLLLICDAAEFGTLLEGLCGLLAMVVGAGVLMAGWELRDENRTF